MSRDKKAKAVKAAYEQVFKSEHGQVVLLDLIESTGMMGSSLDYNRPDALTLAFNDGAKSIVGRIIQQVEMKPETFLNMMVETIAETGEVLDV